MSGYHLAETADLDLFEISLYLARQGGVETAERFLSQVKARFERLADTPGMGRLRADLAPGLRSFVVRPYVVFYTASGDGVFIVRVLHGSRDLDTIFPAEQDEV